MFEYSEQINIFQTIHFSEVAYFNLAASWMKGGGIFNVFQRVSINTLYHLGQKVAKY